MPKRVVILGGGFAGVQAATELARHHAALHPASRPALDILLIANQNHLLFTPLLPQVASSNVDPRHIAQPIRDIRARRAFRFLRAEATRVDLDARRVETNDASADYDYLILAAGSRTDYFGVPGARENTWDFKTLADAVILRERVLDMCEHADHASDPETKRRMLTFVIVGGGYTGIELVTELHDFLFGYVVRHYRGISAGDIHLIVLEATNEILRGIHPKLKAHSMKRLSRKGIEVRMQSPAVRCDAHGVELRGGQRLDSETVIWTAGVRAHQIAESLPVEHDRIGRILVNDQLQLESHPEVFVAGDCAAPRSSMEAPRVAPVGIDEGALAARNILHAERGQPLESYRYVSKGMLVSLGLNYAVVTIGGIRVSGFFAWLFWNSVHLYKLVGLKKQIQVAIDWTMALLFPRDAMIVRRPLHCPICAQRDANTKSAASQSESKAAAELPPPQRARATASDD